MKKFKIVKVVRYVVVDSDGRKRKRHYGADSFIKRQDAQRLKEDLEQGKAW